MAWKNPKEEMALEENHNSAINLIGSGTIIKGDVSSDGDLRIDGKVIGTISSKSKVVVGASGIVEGEIKSQNTDIYGFHKGNVHAQEMVFLKSTANLVGDITTNKIVIEAGAIFKGRCNMGAGGSSASSLPGTRKLTKRALALKDPKGKVFRRFLINLPQNGIGNYPVGG